MPVALYMDHNVPRSITTSLRLRGVDTLTAFEDGAQEMDDSSLLDRATELKRVLFTQDDDLLTEAAIRQRKGIYFCGVIFAHQLNTTIGACVNDLELIAEAGNLQDFENRVEYLPFRV